MEMLIINVKSLCNFRSVYPFIYINVYVNSCDVCLPSLVVYIFDDNLIVLVHCCYGEKMLCPKVSFGIPRCGHD